MGAPEPWYVDAFRDGYLDVYPHRDVESARREADYLVAHGVGGRVLDVCCGFGRHVSALRKRGVDAFGVDFSGDLLRRAVDVRGRVLRGDARRLPVRDACLDAAVSLFSSFGYFGEEGDRAVLAEIARVLKPGGRLVLDLMNPVHVRATLVPETRGSTGDSELWQRRSLEDGGRRVVKEVRLRRASGVERAWREEVRMYAPEEVAPMLAAAGFEHAGTHGDYDASPLSPASPRQIVIARRRAGRSV